MIPLTGPAAIEHALKKLDVVALEAEHMNVIRSKKVSKRPRAVAVLNALEGLKRNNLTPSDLLIKSVPVIPPAFRPFSVVGNTFVPGDANELYRDLIQLRDAHDEAQGILGDTGTHDAKLALYDSVKALYGYGDPVLPKTKQRGVSGFMRQISSTSPKFSFFQRKLISKTMDSVARGTIAVDPELSLNQIGVPRKMAWTMYSPHIQRRMVTSMGMSPADALDHLTKRSDFANRALEAEVKVRPVIYSRAPSWHKFNVLAGHPKLIDGDTIMINPLTTTGMNADFNGDSCHLDYGFVPVLVDGCLVTEDFEKLLSTYVTPGFSEDMAISNFGVGTQMFDFQPGRFHVLGIKDNRPAWVEASHISVHTSHSDECRRVCSLRGLSAVFTSHHNFVKLNDKCEFVAVKTNDVRVGDLIPLAHGYSIPEFTSCAPKSPNPLTLDFSAGFWFGHYLGDGSITGRADTVSQASTDPLTLDYLETAGAAFFSETPWREGNGFSTRWTSRPWVEFFLREIGAGAEGKRVPSWMLGAPAAFRYGLIAGFLAAEGNADGSVARVEVVNPGMLVSFRFLLESLCVPCSIKPGKKAKKNHQATFVLRISGDRLQALGIAWPATQKCVQFSAIKPSNRCPDWNRVPLPSWLKPVIAQQGRLFEGGRGRYKTRKRSRRVPDFKQTKISFAQGYCSRLHAAKIIEGYALQEVDEIRVARWVLLVNDTNVAWDVISSITPVERPVVTYDFSVPGMEMFAIQGGFFTHNTMNLHVPAGHGAVAEAYEKLLPSKMLFSIRDHDKVVPLPKHEQILGMFSAVHRPAKAKHVFATQKHAMDAIHRGDVSLSDEIEYPGMDAQIGSPPVAG